MLRVVKNHMFTHFSLFVIFYQKNVKKVTKFGTQIDLKSSQKMIQKRASNFITFLNILVPQMDAKIEPMPAHKSQETPQAPPRERQDTPQEHPMTPGTVLDLFLSDFGPMFVPFWTHLAILLHPFGPQLGLI